MSLDLSKLEKVRERAEKTIARCPVCALSNADDKAEHLYLGTDGGYRCIVGCDSKAIFALAGNKDTLPSSGPALVIRPRPATVKPKTPFAWPELQRGTASDFRQLARLRDVSGDSLKMMSERGLLRFANFDEERAWVAVMFQ